LISRAFKLSPPKRRPPSPGRGEHPIAHVDQIEDIVSIRNPLELNIVDGVFGLGDRGHQTASLDKGYARHFK
jgi:hypothetical protein